MKPAPQQSTTFCRICEAQCGLKVTVENDHITAIAPDEDHVVSKGYACIKGLTFEDFRRSPDRLTQPLKKVEGQFVAISWQQAFEEIGAKVKQLRKDHGDNSVGLYFGNPISFSLLSPIFINGFVAGLKTGKFFNTGTLDCNNKFVASHHIYGSPMALSFPDVDRNQFLLIMGGNPVISKMSFIHLPHPVKRLQAIVERGGRVVNVNPRRTETAKQVGEHVFIRPDTDVFFLASFLNEILERDRNNPGLIKHDRVKKYMKGFERLQDVVAPWPAERTETVTQIPAQSLRELVTAYLQADGAALYLSTGVNQGSNGTLAFWLQEVINAITGNLDKVGGVQMGEGIFDYPKLLAKSLPPTIYSRIGNTPSFLQALPAPLMADEILEPGADRIRALFVISGNPLITATNSEKFARALDQLELKVSVEIFRNETAEQANYILPGTHFAERPDIPFLFASLCGTTPVPWFHYTDALVPPPGHAKDELWILTQLAQHCDAPLFGSRIVQTLFNVGAWLGRLPWLGKKLTATPERLLGLICKLGKMGSLQQLRRHPHGVLRDAIVADNYFGKRVVCSDGKIQLAPEPFVNEALSRLETSFADKQRSRDAFMLITKRERFSHNSWSHNHEKYITKDRQTNYLYIHPADAAAYNLADHETVRVSSAAGAVVVPVKFDDDMMRRAVALPHGWGHAGASGLSIASRAAGVNANILASDGPHHIEPLSGMAQFNGIEVRIEKVAVL